MCSCIYKISSINKPDRIYIGSAVIYSRRKSEHLKQLRGNNHHSTLLQRHFNKYGESDLVYEIIEIVEEKCNLIKREQFYLDSILPYFNICKTAGSTLGYKHNDSTRLKMSKSNLGKKRPMSEEQKKLLSKLKTGTKLSDSTRLKMSLSHIGRKYKPASEETKAKIGMKNRGKIKSEEFKNFMREKMKGNSYHKKVNVIDTNTGKVFTKIKDAAIYNNINLSTLSAMLHGRFKNKTTLKILSV